MENKKMGRPTKSPRVNDLKIRLSNEELEMLQKCSDTLGIPKAEVIRQGVQKIYETL